MPLHLKLPEVEGFDEKTLEFVRIGGQELDLEYSLYTISLWESKWKKPFLTTMEKMTPQEWIGLLKCMCVTPNIPDVCWALQNADIRKDILDYMADPMSATTVNNHGKKPGRSQIITTEIVYYWMTAFNIPFECEHWHFNRLMKLIEVCMVKQAPPQKMSKSEAARRQHELNAMRLAQWNTKG